MRLSKKVFLRILLAAVSVAGLWTLPGCDDEKRIDYGRLPAAAREFIEHYFPASGVSRVVRDKDDGRTDYEVLLDDGTQIDFDGAGAWIQVECGFSALPEGLVPPRIMAHLAAHYPERTPYEIERETGGYLLTVTGGIELVYTSAGDFVREQR